MHANVDYARGVNTLNGSNQMKSVKRSPSYKDVKYKIRNSVKKGTKYLKDEGRKFSELLENSLTRNDKKHVSFSSNKHRSPIDVNKYIQSHVRDNTLDLTDSNVQKLVKQIIHQVEIQDELRDAIVYCRSTAEFENSTELVEAECLGLISQLKETSALMELQHLNTNDERASGAFDSKTGSVSINSIRFTLKDEIYANTQFNYFYLCAFIYRGEVQSTIVKEKERHGNNITFDHCKLKFEPLEPNFNILVEVYALCLPKNRLKIRPDQSPIVSKVC